MNLITIKDNQTRPLLTLAGKSDDLDNLEPKYQDWLKEFYIEGVAMVVNKKSTTNNTAEGSSVAFVKVGDLNFLEYLIMALRESKFAKDNNLQIFYNETL